MSYCVCGGYLGSGGVDGYAGRWCRCANPRQAEQPLSTSTFTLPTYKDYYEPSDEQKVIDQLVEALKFTIKAAEHLYQPDKELSKDMLPCYYITLSYEGDLELIKKTKEARQILKFLGVE